MSKAPSMPMYWDAYLADTTHLTTEEHGAYLLLLAAMWRRNGVVPDNDRDNARILGLTVAKWKRTKARLLQFLVVKDGNITQKKLLEIWENTQEKIAVNAANGAKGGRAAASKIKDLSQANAANPVKPKSTIPEPEPEPIERDAKASTKKPPAKRGICIPDNWAPNDVNIDHANSKQFTDEEIRNEADKFRDHHLAKGTASKDWNASWRTWIANSIKYGNRGNSGNRNADATLRAIAFAGAARRTPSEDSF